jgi:hypothetical protein
MQMRGLLIAVAALAALGVAIWWSNREPSVEEKAKNLSAKTTKLMSLLEADLVEVKVTPKGEEPRILTQDGASQKWQLSSAFAKEPNFPTDFQAATTAVNTAATIPTDKSVDDNAQDLIQYGLDPPQYVVEIKDKTGKTDRVFYGDDTPVGQMVYAMKPGTKEVYTVAAYLRDGINKGLEDYRDKRFLLIDEAKVTGLALTRRGQTVEFGKDAKAEWQVTKPEPMRADNLAVVELFRKANEAKYAAKPSTEEARKNATAFAGATPVGLLRVTLSNGMQQLEVRKAKDNSCYAKAASTPDIHKANEDLCGALDKELDEFRNKNLFSFGFDDLQHIEVKADGKSTVLERKGQDWMLSGKKADAATVQPVADQLRMMAGMKFVKGQMGASFLEISVLAKDAKASERVMVSKKGNFHYAQRQGEAIEFEVDPKVISDFRSALGAVKLDEGKKK